MEARELITILGYVFITYFTYKWACKKENLFLTFLAPLGISAFIILSNFIFTYRIDLLEWNTAKSLSAMFLSFIMMAINMSVPVAIIILLSILKNKKR